MWNWIKRSLYPLYVGVLWFLYFVVTFSANKYENIFLEHESSIELCNVTANLNETTHNDDILTTKNLQGKFNLIFNNGVYSTKYI